MTGVVWSCLEDNCGIKSYQVVGERGSGTRFVEAMIENNFDLVERADFGWKHGFPTCIGLPRDLVLIVVVRNAFLWIESLYRRPHHASPVTKRRRFPQFIRNPFESIVRGSRHFGVSPNDANLEGVLMQLDRDPIGGDAFANPLKMRTAKLKSLVGLEARGANVIYLNFDEVLRDLPGTVEEVALLLGSEAACRFSFGEKRFSADWQSNTSRKYPADLDRERDYIVSQLDLELEHKFRFSY